MELPSVDQQTIIISLLTGIGGVLVKVATSILKREKEFGEIITSLKNVNEKLDRIERDVDGIALFVGTPRAIATKQKKEAEEKGDK